LDKVFDERLKTLADRDVAGVLSGGRKGIEKESLRVTPDGKLSREPHPVALGSALTNSYITTDFSEALLEFVTPAFPQTWEALRFLCDIHQFTYANLADELLWVSSMPCLIMPDSDIPLARYGDSNVGRMKTAYRRGLGHRYGRAMQTIAGLHFNYSLPEPFWDLYPDLRKSKHSADALRSDGYLGLIRNFRRFGWLVLYLFGASPAVCKSFAPGGESGLQEFDKDSLFEPHATSLRMSDLGYSNKTQASINISLNELDEYITGLSAAIDTKEPDYEKFGLLVDGKYQQLSLNKLQIENEYYSPIRPKRVARSGERPTSALRRGGIEYVEVRSLDLGIVDPVGINQNTMRFMEAFLIYCLLCDSPNLDDPDWQELAANHSSVAKYGRDPALKLRRDGATVAMRDWAREIVLGVQAVAELIDRGSEHDDYQQAVNAQLALVGKPDATPSARVLQELGEQKIGFFRYALQCAESHKDYFAALAPLSDESRKMFEQEVAESISRQREIELADQVDFENYLRTYYAS
jgi:glutamate--cysteine ligase